MVLPWQSPYRQVEVRGLVWEGNGHHQTSGPVRNADQEFHMVLEAFRTYGYNVKITQISKDRHKRSELTNFLQAKFDNLVHRSSSTLIILYYQGHGSLDRDGHLMLTKYGKDLNPRLLGTGQWMYWSDIANAVISARCDVLTILNCCHAGAAVTNRHSSRPNYERHLKELIMAVPRNSSTSWGRVENFAACLEQALRDHRNNWENGFRGNPSHWVQAINRVMVRKPRGRASVLHDHLIRPPPNAADRPIIMSPRRVPWIS
ncbi:hypothetical protein GJ744_001402 [Endocarpon pusillum]|uniref:Peptidase C14 caspase domain-containing protein n=1 Tax=Endocarpon pusillum TaxID=364733 RepID=A0A8H7AT40_9EURO|nr:hypothetical protein GJ744_001402 [Endocarpon pusillum]